MYESKMCIVGMEPLKHLDNDVKVNPMRTDNTE